MQVSLISLLSTHAHVGKSTLMELLRSGHLKALPPTFQPGNVYCYSLQVGQEFTLGGIRFSCTDLGGHKGGTLILTHMSLPLARKLWASYFPQVSGIVFMVDASAKERIAEAKKELDGILSHEYIADIPIVI